MISLFIDTSLENVSISIIKDNKILSLISKDIPNEHSIYTTSFIKDVLDETNILPTDIDSIYVVNGPGSFTGLRIGVTIAKTYGYLIKKEIHPVSSLKQLAISSNYDGNIMSIIPANRNNYYIGIYDKEYNIILDEQFASIDKVIEIINKYNPYIVGTHETDIDKDHVNKVKLDIIKIINYYRDKKTVNYFALVPNYKKLPQAIEDRMKKND